ncbi:MAG TPA: tetratricopeptide repeat protein [Opitutaceae bacterium]|nr:tetratricopeptide repeat protein [Opitutaceae bacterium]
MIRHRLASFQALVALSIATTLAGTVAAEPAPLAGLAAARESTAPAIATPMVPLTPASGGPPAPAVASPAKHPVPAKDEIHGLLNLGESLTDRANPDYEAAAIAYRQVLNSTDADADATKTALLGLAHMHRKKGDLTKAAAIYEKFLATYPGDDRSPDALLELGRTLRDMGAYKLAIARFYSVINSTIKLSGNAFAHYQVLAKTAAFEIAETHFAAGEYAEANKYYTKFRLLDVAPADRARAQFKAAYALRLEGNLDQAVTSLRSFIEQWPNDPNAPEARYLLAVTLRDLKRPQEALAVALDLLRTEKSKVAAAPKVWMHWQLLTGNQIANEFFETGDVVDAHTIYTALLELSPEKTWRLPITYQLGLCYERLGIMGRARSSYQSVVDLAGANPPAEYSELAHMAAWRIQHLDWQTQTNRNISAFFDSTTGKQASNASPSPKAAATP